MELAGIEKPLVLCTHRPVLPTVMDALSSIFDVDVEAKKTFDPALTPGSLVIYHREVNNLTRIVAVERHLH
jgi:8-oxo-dGTP diphosphatase